ncbi:hypothetical protein [Rhodococcus ruber]
MANEEARIDPRRERTREVVFRTAVALAEEEKLSGKSLRSFAEDAGVALNTLKSHDYKTPADVAEDLLRTLRKRKGAYNLKPSDRAMDHIKDLARASTAFGDHDKVQAIHLKVTQITEALRRRSISSEHATEELEKQYGLLVTNHADRLSLMAEMCNSIALAYLQGGKRSFGGEAAEHALHWAKTGLKHLESDRHTRQFDLGRRVSEKVSAAARMGITASLDALTEESTEAERKDVLVEVMKHLSTITNSKMKERDYARKMKNPLRAAAAEFHRARAEALIQGEPAGEIEAALQMARELAGILDSLGSLPDGEDILTTYLPRLCATQVAYRRQIESDTHEELDRIRTRLIDALGKGPLSDQARIKATTRALRTLFVFADNARNPQSKPKRPADVHLTDLVMISTYGVVGRVLLADHLRQAAHALDSGEPLYESSTLVTIGKHEYLNAARYWYEAAINRTLILGAAAELTRRARQALREEDMVSADPTKPWPILANSGLNVALFNQLSIGAVTGSLPTSEQARELLDEFHPFLMVLESIAEGKVGPVEVHA